MIHEGYRYRKDKVHLSSTSWRCTEKYCKGRLIVCGDSKKPTTSHSHGPNDAKNEVFRIMENVMNMARTTEDGPRKILQASTSQVSIEASVLLPNYDAARKTIQRVRNKELLVNSACNSIRDVTIEEKYKRTEKGEEFLLWDSGTEDVNRIIVFATYGNIFLLSEFRNWCLDGTFSVAPKYFCQVFTIHSLIDGKAIPLIYALLPNKQQSSYERLFGKLLEIDSTLKPTSVICDFENAVFNTINNQFPDTRIVGCNFHLTRNLWKHIQSNQLTKLYKDDEEIRIQCKMLLALSYVPVQDVQFAFEVIVASFPAQLKPIVDYFEDNYVGRRLHDIPPRFPIEMWNLYERINTDLPRSNNSVEAWHNSFQKTLQCHKPSHAKLFEKIRKEQSYYELFITRYRAGYRANEKRNCKYFQLRKRLQVLVAQYRFGSVLKYLRCIAYNLSL